VGIGRNGRRHRVVLSHLAFICFLSNYVVNLNNVVDLNFVVLSRPAIVVNIDINLLHVLFDFYHGFRSSQTMSS
jgi:hypothetical protein